MAEDTTTAVLGVTPTVVPLDPSRQRSSTSATSSLTDSFTRPLYIPAVLQHTGPRNKHLAGVLGRKQAAAAGEDGAAGRKKVTGEGAKGGKRKRRRWENAQLAHNPHLHRPTRADFSPGPSLKNLSTTFAPPPLSFSRSTYVSSSPSSAPSSADLAAASDAGLFSMSMRGLRRNLRTAIGGGGGGRTEEILEIMERELVAWLTLSGRVPDGFFHESRTTGGKLLDPTPVEDLPYSAALPSLPDLPPSSPSSSLTPPGPPTLTELSRQPHSLAWLLPHPHHRYLLHCLARYYALQSFSRPLSPLEPDVRVTHVLRPQLVRPRAGGAAPAGAAGGGANPYDTPDATTDYSTAGGEETSTAGESSAYETETDADEEAWERASVASSFDAPAGERYSSSEAEAADEGGGSSADERAYASSTDSARDERIGEGEPRDEEVESSEYDSAADGDGGVDSLASSLADLSTATPSRASAAPFSPSTPLPPSPFISLTPRPSVGGASTPVAPSPLSLAAGADATPTRPSRALERTRGRRSLPPASASPLAASGYASPTESSPSRSRTRDAGATTALRTGVREGGMRAVGVAEWRMPERGFLEWVLGA